MIISSPTCLGIRSDSKGDGAYGAMRGIRRHKGTDFLCVPGQDIVCPIDEGIITRENYPYPDLSYHGLTIRSKDIEIVIFYCEVLPGLVRQTVFKGQVIAEAEDISAKWGKKMKPHVHLEIKSINPELFLDV